MRSGIGSCEEGAIGGTKRVGVVRFEEDGEFELSAFREGLIPRGRSRFVAFALSSGG